MKWSILPRPQYEGPPDKKEAKKRRAPFFLRLSATSVDVALAICLTPIIKNIVPGSLDLAMQLSMLCYYIVTEMCFGQTPGKMLCGVELVSIRGDLTPAKVFMRNFWRGIAIMTGVFPLGIPLLLAWNRVSLLDKLTSLRVVRPEEVFVVKARRGKIAPRFNEELLKR